MTVKICVEMHEMLKLTRHRREKHSKVILVEAIDAEF